MNEEKQCEIPRHWGKGRSYTERPCERMTRHRLPEGTAICKSHLSAWRRKENTKLRAMMEESALASIQREIGLGYVRITELGDAELSFSLPEARLLMKKVDPAKEARET